MKKILFTILFLFFIGLLGVFFVSQKVTEALTQTALVDQAQTLNVKKGTAVYRLFDELDERGMFQQSIWLKIAVRLDPSIGLIKAGTYDVFPQMSLSDLLDDINEGREKQFLITLVEGLTLSEWINQLNNTNFLTSPLSKDDIASWVAKNKIEGQSLEGWLLADSYAVTYGTAVIKVVERAHLSMQSMLSDLWEKRYSDLPYESPYQALIMASIIEKETGVPSEREHIAGVFVNRLNANMRLQTDPTVIYGIGEAFDGNLTRKHLRTPTDYNTYVIKGLPPTPIAMTSKASLIAAFNPMLTDDFYFVAKGDGTHYFSSTLEQHNRAVREYQLGIKE